jgi:hypothetical protein
VTTFDRAAAAAVVVVVVMEQVGRVHGRAGRRGHDVSPVLKDPQAFHHFSTKQNCFTLLALISLN